MRQQSPGTALRFYRARAQASTRYSSSPGKPPPLPKCFTTRHPVSAPSMVPRNLRRPVSSPAGGRFQKTADASGRAYLVDKLTGAWTPVAELTDRSPSPLRDAEDAAMPTRPSACHPGDASQKRGREEGLFRTGKSADDNTSIVSESSQKSLQDEVAALRARLDRVEERAAADLLALETVVAWLKDSHDGAAKRLAFVEAMARGG